MLFGLADEAALIRGEPVINLDPKGIVPAVSVGVRIFPDRLSIDLQRFL